jgi:hypothetical protein
MFALRLVYLVLAAVGAVVPYIPFARWLRAQSFDWQLPGRFAAELFSTRVGSFFGLDVVLSAVTLFTFMLVEQGLDRPSRAFMIDAPYCGGRYEPLPVPSACCSAATAARASAKYFWRLNR